MEMKYPKYNKINSGHSDSFEIGNSFQDFVCLELAKQNIILQNINSKKFQFEVGENLQGFEIKFDGTCTKTNRLSIEIAEKTDGNNLNWVNSGILRSDNSWLYIQGNYSLFYIFSKNVLKLMNDKRIYEYAEFPFDKPTIKKFYLPFTDADKYCAKKIILKN